jgi:PIN domain nuclease of toxin-antitoxin system
VRYLLDTHALLWWLFDDKRLSTRARALIADPDHEVLVSSASASEIATKHRLGRLDSARELVQDLPSWIARAGFVELPITIAHAQKAGSFPQLHRGPFDRMLSAQGLLEGCPVISRDELLDIFGTSRVW